MRLTVLILTIIVVFAAAAAPFAVIVWLEHRVDLAEIDITCSSARSNIQQLKALRDISDRLGLPTTFGIPELPEGCEAMQG